MKNLKFRKFVSGLLVAIYMMALNAYSLDENTTPSTWAEQSIKEATTEGLLDTRIASSYTKGITRAEFSGTVKKLFDKHVKDVRVSTDNPFTDIDASIFKDDIIKMYHLGVVSGVGNHKFDPDGLITREQIALLMTKTYKYIVNSDTLPDTSLKFNDAYKVSSWAKEGVAFMSSIGIITGMGANNFDPRLNSTREQGVVLVLRLNNHLKKNVANLGNNSTNLKKPTDDELRKQIQNAIKSYIAESGDFILDKLASAAVSSEGAVSENTSSKVDVTIENILIGLQKKVIFSNSGESDKTYGPYLAPLKTPIDALSYYPTSSDYKKQWKVTLNIVTGDVTVEKVKFNDSNSYYEVIYFDPNAPQSEQELKDQKVELPTTPTNKNATILGEQFASVFANVYSENKLAAMESFLESVYKDPKLYSLNITPIELTVSYSSNGSEFIKATNFIDSLSGKTEKTIMLQSRNLSNINLESSLSKLLEVESINAKCMDEFKQIKSKTSITKELSYISVEVDETTSFVAYSDGDVESGPLYIITITQTITNKTE